MCEKISVSENTKNVIKNICNNPFNMEVLDYTMRIDDIAVEHPGEWSAGMCVDIAGARCVVSVSEYGADIWVPRQDDSQLYDRLSVLAAINCRCCGQIEHVNMA
jgi:hypothetical protein